MKKTFTQTVRYETFEFPYHRKSKRKYKTFLNDRLLKILALKYESIRFTRLWVLKNYEVNWKLTTNHIVYRSSRPEVFVGKVVLKICSKFTGEHPWQSIISIKLLWNFIEITLWHTCSPINLLDIFRTLFYKNTSRWLLLSIATLKFHTMGIW